MRTLKVTSGPGAGQSLEVEQEIVIGREDANLTIADPEISRRHVVIRPVDRGVEVEDLGSLNGTFVNGERIGQVVTLTAGGVVRVGTSEIEVELDLLAATRAREALPGAAQRTRVRETPSPPAAAPPAQPEPAAAAAPPPAQPQPPAPAAPPEAPRPVAPPTPPPTPTPPPAAPAAQPAAKASPVLPGGPRRPAPPPRYGPAPGAGRARRLPKGAVLGIGALAAAALVVVVILLLAGGGSTKRRPLSATLTTGVLTQRGNLITFAGTVSQSPGGSGAATVQLTPQGDLGRGKPVGVTGKLVLRFDTGRIDSTLRGTATPQRNGTTNVVGQGTITGGSGKYAGAKGTYSLTSSQGAAKPTVGHTTLRGSIQY